MTAKAGSHSHGHVSDWCLQVIRTTVPQQVFRQDDAASAQTISASKPTFLKLTRLHRQVLVDKAQPGRKQSSIENLKCHDRADNPDM